MIKMVDMLLEWIGQIFVSQMKEVLNGLKGGVER